jgi:hypothetical protein
MATTEGRQAGQAKDEYYFKLSPTSSEAIDGRGKRDPVSPNRKRFAMLRVGTGLSSPRATDKIKGHDGQVDHTELPLFQAASVSPRHIPHMGIVSYSSVDALMENRPALSTPFSGNMDMLLSPSTGTEDLDHLLELDSTVSSRAHFGPTFSSTGSYAGDDPIMARVEEELAAARKQAVMEPAEESSQCASFEGTSHDDMEDILNTTTSVQDFEEDDIIERADPVEAAREHYSPSFADSENYDSSFDATYAQFRNEAGISLVDSDAQVVSFDQVLHLIDDEFEGSDHPLRETSPPHLRDSSHPLVQDASPPSVRDASPPPVRDASPPQVRDASPPQVRDASPPQVRDASPSQVRDASPQRSRQKELTEIDEQEEFRA